MRGAVGDACEGVCTVDRPRAQKSLATAHQAAGGVEALSEDRSLSITSAHVAPPRPLPQAHELPLPPQPHEQTRAPASFNTTPTHQAAVEDV